MKQADHSHPERCLRFSHRTDWRNWLEIHHTIKSEAWLIINRSGHQDGGLNLDETVEEALCFGWIDSRLQPIDEKRYALRFSPRTARSVWSGRNIQKVEKLIANGKMTDAGNKVISIAKKNGQWDEALRREQVDTIPEELEDALKSVKGAKERYLALPASMKKRFIYWLQSAKKEQTRQKRIKAILAEISGSNQE